MKKIAILFPGIGYTSDRPLLHGAKMLAQEQGFQVIDVTYSGFPKDIRGDAAKMQQSFEIALDQTERLLKTEDFRDIDKNNLLFVSKSIGTAVAGAYQKKHGISGKNIYFTPLAQSFPFLSPKSGIVFHGTSDPWAETESIKQGCRQLELPLYLTEGANHSLETGDKYRDEAILKDVMKLCLCYL
ncbi:MAG: alpha/beta hydrolase [Lachnospiraceae bacterium]|nr:alpha/beta hydrolase [Lachnospiraceae bacterium]